MDLPSFASFENRLPVQIVYLTFDDAMTELASSGYYEGVFGDDTEFLNPNGCPIRATHFLTHEYCDYSLVNKWWARGHEMASHGIRYNKGFLFLFHVI